MLRQRRIGHRIWDTLTLLRRAEEGVLKVFGELWPREVDKFLNAGRMISRWPVQPGFVCLTTCLETLCIPPFDFFNARHLMQPLGQLVELLDTVCQANRQFGGEKLRRPQKRSLSIRDHISTPFA